MTMLQNKATVPSLLELELQTNPFLRSDQEEIRQSLGEIICLDSVLRTLIT